VEELFISRGVCLVSHGPLGGPSLLKGLYRPLISYGTGVGLCEVVKAKFSDPIYGGDNSHRTTNNSGEFVQF